MTEKELDEKEKEISDQIKKSCLLTISSRVSDYKIDLYFRSFSVIIISLFCMMILPADTLNIFRKELPVSVFYIMLAVALVSIMAFGALGYSKGRPWIDVEKAVEADRVYEAISIIEDMDSRKTKIEILDTVVLMITIAFIVISFSFGYHADCSYCNTENYVTSSDCSKCGSETDFNKDMIQYIITEF